jgi:hypothetical protein
MPILLSIVTIIAMSVIAWKKGFNPLLWILAGGPPGLLILVFMTPSANAPDIDEATRSARRKRGNIVGGVISGMLFALGIAFGILSSGS